jgi:PPOX class probable F420-dependent enzyme
MIQTADDIWDFLSTSHTGILTTLRRDGAPVSSPVWFVVDDHTIALMAPSSTKKVARIRHDPRAAFLVESGERWDNLSGVHLNGQVEIVDDAAQIVRIDNALANKYAVFRPDTSALPDKTQAIYASETFLRFHPDGHPRWWDNSRIAMRQP